MGAKFLYAAVILACLLTSDTRLAACECVGPISPCLAAEQSQAVFVGRVTGISDVEPPSQGGARFFAKRVVFTVTETFRGDLPEGVTVFTGSGGGDCGFKFDAGKTYLVYAHQEKSGQLSTGICARTREATSGARSEIQELRALAAEPRKCRQP